MRVFEMRMIWAACAALLVAVGIYLWQSPGAAQAQVTLAAPSGQALADDPSLLVVDIRTADEWRDTGVIEDALLVTYTDAASFLAAVTPHLAEGQSIALICRSGNRTSRAARQIAALSPVPVIDVAGGMLRVLGEGYRPVAPSAAQGCTSC
jgi:rhodanese-related sulfurtransferase